MEKNFNSAKRYQMFTYCVFYTFILLADAFYHFLLADFMTNVIKTWLTVWKSECVYLFLCTQGLFFSVCVWAFISWSRPDVPTKIEISDSCDLVRIFGQTPMINALISSIMFVCILHLTFSGFSTQKHQESQEYCIFTQTQKALWSQ